MRASELGGKVAVVDPMVVNASPGSTRIPCSLSHSRVSFGVELTSGYMGVIHQR